MVELIPSNALKLSHPLEFSSWENSEDLVPGILRIPRGRILEQFTLCNSMNCEDLVPEISTKFLGVRRDIYIILGCFEN